MLIPKMITIWFHLSILFFSIQVIHLSFYKIKWTDTHLSYDKLGVGVKDELLAYGIDKPDNQFNIVNRMTHHWIHNFIRWVMSVIV